MKRNLGSLATKHLLEIGEACAIADDVQFVPSDLTGNLAKIVIEDDVRVDSGTTIFGGSILRKGTIIEQGCNIGKPEYGYAGPDAQTYEGRSYTTEIGPAAIIRSQAIVYSGTTIGAATMVGHFSTVRSHVEMGASCQLAAYSHIERRSKIGYGVRMSPHCHITAETFVGNDVFLGAGVLTVNDRSMVWTKDLEEKRLLNLSPPTFSDGCKIGTGSIISSNVHIGESSMVGSGSLVLRDVPPRTLVYGVPARTVRELP